ncbi:hypothetical protein [Microbulbifer sp. SAOS-129_SWC]|uniref:hypothetical protein n=1 Tax=Microbulbifer sp. SAOS-129_SWC TaxID=3145235 RepID=UPI0032170E9E
MTVYVHPTVTTAQVLREIERRTGRLAVVTHSGRRLRLAEPKRKPHNPGPDDWPPFGGHAA